MASGCVANAIVALAGICEVTTPGTKMVEVLVDFQRATTAAGAIAGGGTLFFFKSPSSHHASLGTRDHLVRANLWIVAAKATVLAGSTANSFQGGGESSRRGIVDLYQA